MTIDLELPRDINSIKLSEWQKFSKLVDDNKDSTNDFLEIKMLEIFAGLKYKDIHTLPVGTFDEAIEYLNLLFQSKTPLVRRFSMTGTDDATVEFGFIPNLDKITMGEYIDLNNYLDDPATLHKAMAVLFRPIHPSYNKKESYRISSYEGSDFFSDLMRDMPLGIALGAKVFFLSFRNQIVEGYSELYNRNSRGTGTTIGGREEAFNGKYSWYKELHALAGGQALRVNEATSIPIHEAMIWLQYEKEKRILENEAIKKQFKR